MLVTQCKSFSKDFPLQTSRKKEWEKGYLALIKEAGSVNPVDWFDVVHQNQVGHQGNCGAGQESLLFWWSHPGNCLAGNIKA